MAPDQAASLRAQHWREFMEEVLGIASDTPLADVLPSVIMKAAKPHYASILTEAAVKARSMATGNNSSQMHARQLAAPQFSQSTSQGQVQGNVRPFSPYPRNQQKYTGPKPAVSPDFIRAKLDLAIFNLNLPSQLFDKVRFTGYEGTTGSGNFRMDFSDWTFGPGPLPPNAVNMLEALFKNVFELDAQGVMITSYTIPYMVRITFRSEYRGRLFDSALKAKATALQSRSRDPSSLTWRRSSSPGNARNEIIQFSSSSSGAPVSDQYPPRTSFQDSTTGLIDTYRPNGLPPTSIDSYRPSSIPSRADSGNQRLSSHKADSRQNVEKHPAEALREHGRNRNGREIGRLSPVRDVEIHSSRMSPGGVKREREDSPTRDDTTTLLLRPQVKRPRATDFIDMGDDHYP
ncbi:hypothetical protein FKW77_002458 [Venturia effusa]|uniref:Uncharacterized protein n=1 Tax=Venturia effusa TaxID=50376 RepID=A0A517LMC5_9PEZI|nr:hypothetical protein FKW77_002458 [Venturia effusa]